MANPTTNYGFVLPEPTSLVTDLPADFDVALQGVDTRLKALQPGTTAGDLAYASSTANTNVRLGIGTAGQNLTVVSGVPAWTTLVSGGLTLITTQSFTTAGTVSVNDCFSTTYDYYKIILSLNASGSIAINSRFRVSGSDDTASNYRTQRQTTSTTSVSAALSATTTSMEICDLYTAPTIIDCAIYNPFASKKTNAIFTSPSNIPPEYWIRSNIFNDTTSFTGISFITTSGTVTGTLSVFGYSK